MLFCLHRGMCLFANNRPKNYLLAIQTISIVAFESPPLLFTQVRAVDTVIQVRLGLA